MSCFRNVRDPNKLNSLDLSKDYINSIVNEALVKVDDNDDDDDEAEIQRTIDGDIIPIMK